MSMPQEPREPLLEALRRVDLAQWRREVRAVLEAHVEVDAAARALGVRLEILERWLRADPTLRDHSHIER